MVQDYSNYKRSNTFYAGSERKIALVIDNCEYMLKFQKYSEFGKKMNNHISEYLGSHIFSALKVPTQETLLGKYKGEEVVLCKNFIPDGCDFVPFNDVGESTLDRDKEQYQYEYDDIIEMIEANSKLTNTSSVIDMFWDMFIIDAYIGNFDRHGSNWGFIKNLISDTYSLAPVFDNGSCLFPRVTNDSEMMHIMNKEIEISERVYKFPTSQVKLNGKKSSYFEVINSLKFPECNKALCRFCEKLNKSEIEAIIDATPFISDINKDFYKIMLSERNKRIIEASYLKLKGRI